MARKMKDSGIEWIGEIPEGWEVVPVKRLCTMQAGKNLTSEQIAPEGTYPVYGGNGIRGFFSDYNCDGQFLTVGRQGALCGNVHKINGKVWATEHAVITTPSSYTSLDFLYYLLIGMDLNQYVSSTAAQPGLAVGTLLNLKTCYPCSTLEQTRISNYLNAKCSEIDVMLSKTRSSIEEYKKLKQAVITQAVTKGVRGEREMKDSGVEWIGEINHSFSLIKLKYICSILDQYRKPISADKRSQNSTVLYDYYGASGVIDQIDGYTIDDHVMLIGEDGANLRMRNLPLMYEVCGKAWINNHAHILKPTERVNFYYLFYALEGLDINPYITGSAQPKLSQEKLQNIWIPLPSLEEQQEIATYIRSKCAEIDELIAKKDQLVKELESYKKSLIYEVVTGKREV